MAKCKQTAIFRVHEKSICDINFIWSDNSWWNLLYHLIFHINVVSGQPNAIYFRFRNGEWRDHFYGDIMPISIGADDF